MMLGGAIHSEVRDSGYTAVSSDKGNVIDVFGNTAIYFADIPQDVVKITREQETITHFFPSELSVFVYSKSSEPEEADKITFLPLALFGVDSPKCKPSPDTLVVKLVHNLHKVADDFGIQGLYDVYVTGRQKVVLNFKNKCAANVIAGSLILTSMPGGDLSTKYEKKSGTVYSIRHFGCIGYNASSCDNEFPTMRIDTVRGGILQNLEAWYCDYANISQFIVQDDLIDRTFVVAGNAFENLYFRYLDSNLTKYTGSIRSNSSTGTYLSMGSVALTSQINLKDDLRIGDSDEIDRDAGSSLLFPNPSLIESSTRAIAYFTKKEKEGSAGEQRRSFMDRVINNLCVEAISGVAGSDLVIFSKNVCRQSNMTEQHKKDRAKRSDEFFSRMCQTLCNFADFYVQKLKSGPLKLIMHDDDCAAALAAQSCVFTSIESSTSESNIECTFVRGKDGNTACIIQRMRLPVRCAFLMPVVPGPVVNLKRNVKQKKKKNSVARVSEEVKDYKSAGMFAVGGPCLSFEKNGKRYFVQFTKMTYGVCASIGTHCPVTKHTVSCWPQIMVVPIM